jgi:polar amino acid transport system substrate-binding protein
MKRFYAFMLIAVSLVVSSACQTTPEPAPTPLPVPTATNEPVSSNQLTVITEDFPPLNYAENGVAVGPSVEIVKAIQAKLGIDNKIEVYPWARGYKMTTDNANTAIFSTSWNKERDPLFKWVGPIAVKKYMFYAKAGSGIKISSLEDAKAYRIGVQREGVTELDLKAAGFTNLDAVTSQAENLEKLRRGRIDVWYADAGSIVVLCKQAGVDIKELEPVFLVREGKMFIAFNIKTPDATVKAWQDAYIALYNDGTIKKIFERHQLDNFYPTIE